MSLNESDTRAKLIDPALHECGWTEDLIKREETAGAIVIDGGKALKQAKRSKDKDATLTISYIGAPRYRIHVTAPDYKHAESVLKKSAQAVVKYMEQHGGEGTFLREA